jgi:hypothetical protein
MMGVSNQRTGFDRGGSGCARRKIFAKAWTRRRSCASAASRAADLDLEPMARVSHNSIAVKTALTIAGSVALAAVVGAAALLRPRQLAHEQLPASTSIPPAAIQAVKSKMGRHEAQMKALVSRVVLLDDDGVARVAGEIFDEPALARPVAGDELNGLLPERFFELQDDLRARARRLVIAAGRHDHDAMADELAGVTKSCVSCHQVFVHGGAVRVGDKEAP